MSADDIQQSDAPSLTTVWPVFAKIALVPFLSGVALIAYTVALAPEGASLWSSPLAWLLIWVAVLTFLTPLIIIVVYYSFCLAIGLGLFVYLNDVSWGAWPRRLRTGLRAVIILACVAAIAITIPMLFTAPTWKAWKDTALMGIMLPACTIFSLFMSRIEGIGKALAETTRKIDSHP